MTMILRTSNMKISRQRVAATLLAASFAACFASPAVARGQADAPPAAQQPGPGPDGGPRHGFGEHGPGMRGGMHGEMGGGMLEHLHRLNLSEAQQDKLFNIRHAAEPQQREHRKAIYKAHEALAELARSDRFDDARATALSRELGQAVAAEALLRARTEAQALAVLTPEQREQLRRHRTPGPQLRPGQPGRPQAE
jgi:Spy/CpxP family protein refolding chaperone